MLYLMISLVILYAINFKKMYLQLIINSNTKY